MALGDNRSSAQTNTWEYWVPFYSGYLAARDMVNGESPFSFIGHAFGSGTKDGTSGSNSYSLESESRDILNTARDELLADRDHTEMREDTAYQRAVKDMKEAGLNPYTIGAQSAPSSASSVGSDMVSNKLQILGYILDLKNLDAKNRKITNDSITNVLSVFKKK